MLPYRYQPLQHSDSIRILILRPSSNTSDPLIARLRHLRLSDASLKHEAVSYTWGDNSDQQTIYFHNGGSELRIGRNCHNALRSLRYERQERWLWIDAICIHQQNLRERADQVQIMDRIYTSAFSVLVYLGEETIGSRILF